MITRHFGYCRWNPGGIKSAICFLEGQISQFIALRCMTVLQSLKILPAVVPLHWNMKPRRSLVRPWRIFIKVSNNWFSGLIESLRLISLHSDSLKKQKITMNWFMVNPVQVLRSFSLRFSNANLSSALFFLSSSFSFFKALFFFI